MALARITKAILNDENTVLPLSVYQYEQYQGIKDVFIGQPAIIGAHGIVRPVNLPEGLFAKMVNFGFLSLTIPKEYGGSGFDYDIAWEVVYEISKRSASIGCILEGHYKTIDQIKRFASDRLKEEFLP